MSVTVTFYNHSKKSNSTKVPVSAGTSFDCLLKAPSGILYPTIQLQLPMNNTPLWNYAYIAEFNRYYWVSEWTYEGGLWSAALAVDYMASYKSDIGSTSFYILRAANAQDTKIIDTHYPICNHETETITQADSVWFANVSSVSSGCFVVGLRGRINSDQTAGGITYLAMTPAQFKAFTEDLFDDQLNNYIAGGSLDIGNSLALMIFNPTQYIASCMWLPGMPTTETPATGFNVGWWGFTSGAGIISSMSVLSYAATIACHAHPQATRGNYLNGSPFTSRILVLPRYGVLDITNQIPANTDQINIDLVVDPISGQGMYIIGYTPVGSSTNVIIDEIQCQIGVDVPLSSNQVTIQDAASSSSSAANAVIDAAQFNGVGAFADIASALSVLQPHINDISPASGFLGYSGGLIGTPFMIERYKEVADEDNTEEGRPLCQIRQASTLSGYMKVLHGDIAISKATQSELDMIRNTLEAGFYYE